MNEYEQGFIDGVKSKVSAELAPTIERLARDLTATMQTAVDYAIGNVKITCKEQGEGHWIEHDFRETGDRCDYELPFECSNCHNRQGIFRFRFCPNCGADMRGDTDEQP